MKTVLIIGGPADGQRMNVGNSVWDIVIPEMPDAELLSLCEAVPGTIPRLSNYQYHIHEHVTDHGSHYVATLDHRLDTHSLITALWEGYKKTYDPAPPVPEMKPVILAKDLTVKDSAHQSHLDYAEGYNDRAEMDRNAIRAAGYEVKSC